MTLDELIIEVFDNLGRPTDLSPLTDLQDNASLDPTLSGYQQLQRWINLGYEAVSKWRTAAGKFYRHSDTIKRRFCQFGPHELEGTWAEFNPNDPAFTPTYEWAFPDDDYYVGLMPPDLVWVTFNNLGDDLTFAEVTPETTPYTGTTSVAGMMSIYQNVYQITDADYASLAYFTDEHTLYVLGGVPWIIPETEVTIYEKGIYLNRFNQPGTLSLTDLYAIRSLRIFEPTQQTDAELASRTENFTNNYSELNKPTQYYREKKYLYFDFHVPIEYTYQLEYIQEVTPLTEGTEEPVIQKRFHTPIVYWATYRGLLRLGEPADGYAMFRFLETEMKSIIKEQDMDVERLEGHFIGSGGYNG